MPRQWIITLILLCDEVAHFITPFTLVAILAEIIYRGGDDGESFNTPRRAVIAGSVIGLVGAGAWEVIVIEIALDLMGFPISHSLPDTIFDVVLGVAGEPGVPQGPGPPTATSTGSSDARAPTPTDKASASAR